jgi:hypothetical protein
VVFNELDLGLGAWDALHGPAGGGGPVVIWAWQRARVEGSEAGRRWRHAAGVWNLATDSGKRR